MQVLTVSNLYPNELQIRHGIFVRERLRHYIERGKTAKLAGVIAPIPWFPLGLRQSLRKLGAIPRLERDPLGHAVFHPRYLAIPLIGNFLSPIFFAMAIARRSKEFIGQVNELVVVDAHFAFPDGAATTLFAKIKKLPVVVTLRGSDINSMSREWGINTWTKWMFKEANAVVTVSRALADVAIDLGCDPNKVKVIRNGVDRQRFNLLNNREATRATLAITSKTLLSVGNLIELKGHHLIISALSQLPQWNGIIIGDGPERHKLVESIKRLGLTARIRIVSEISQDELSQYYGAVDVLTLASSREGLPNVVLEALSCGTPVIATNVGGLPEVITNPLQGELIDSHSVSALVTALRKFAPRTEDQRREIRSSIKMFDWSQTVAEMDQLFASLIPDCLAQKKEIS